jgi:NO-binding membrane sensor protein with MHYT domain
MNGSYNLSLVAISVVIAIVASYTALDLANRVSESAASPKKVWSWRSLYSRAAYASCGMKS